MFFPGIFNFTVGILTQSEFRREYLERNQPLIITDAFDHWEALKSWNKEYFLNRFGDQELEIQEQCSN